LIQVSALKKKSILIIVLIMSFYVLLAVYSDINQLIKHLQKIEIYFIVPILLSFTISPFIKSIRQFFLLTKIDVRISFKQNIILYFAGLSMLVTPGGIGGIIKSHFLLKNHNKPISKTAPIIVIERYHDALALFSIVTLFSIIHSTTALTIPIFIVGIFLLLGILIIKNKKLLRLFQQKLGRVRFLKIIEESSEGFNNTLVSISTRRSMFLSWIISLTAVLFEGIGIFLCFQAFGLNFDFILSTTFGLSSVLFGAMSLLPAGVGLTEFSFVQILLSHSVDFSVATALVLFYRLVSIWYVTCIGIVATRFASKQHPK